jgi:hypothetical protein
MDATAATAQDKAKEWWARTKTAVGLQEVVEEEPANASLLDQFSEATTLNKTQRVYGFLICLGCAVFFGFISSLFVVMPTKFAVLFTFANIFAIASTMFLSGPLTHAKKMMEKGRIVATVIYFSSMGLTLFCAIHLHSAILTLLAMIVQLAALAWYCLSYIPYARQLASRMFGVELPNWV